MNDDVKKKLKQAEVPKELVEAWEGDIRLEDLEAWAKVTRLAEDRAKSAEERIDKALEWAERIWRDRGCYEHGMVKAAAIVQSILSGSTKGES